MQAPKLSSRRWFWILTLAAFAWAFIGSRTTPAGNHSPSMMQRTQAVLAWPVDTLLTPGSWIATRAEETLVWVFRQAGVSRTEARTVASLQQEVDKLRDEVSVSEGQAKDLRQQLADLRALLPRGISPGDLVSANIKGYSATTGANLASIDKGTSSGVYGGMPVISQHSIVGRVIDAGPMTATVRLLTDPRSKVRAMLVHREADGDVQLIGEPCLVEGLGNGRIGCNTIKLGDASLAIRKGDVVQLLDPEWPQQLRHFIIGEVDTVRLNEASILRYDIRIVPRANVTALQSVNVLTKW